MAKGKSITISCVLDGHPRFSMQCWNWVLSLKGTNAHQHANIVVHHTPSVDHASLRFIKSLDVQLAPIDPFGDGVAAYCNKINQLESDIVLNSQYAILCDADLVFLKCPTRLAKGNDIRAKIVDRPNPPEHILRALLKKSGLVDDFKAVPTDFLQSDLTLPTNCNGGLLVLPASAVVALKVAWPRWAQFCLDNKDILERWHHHADQLGFALAILETGLPLKLLDVAENFPTHFKPDQYANIAERSLAAIHYHSNMDAHGLPQKVGIPWIDRQIGHASYRILDGRRGHFSNQLFWDCRYQHDPNLGSGIGSRGDLLLTKRALIAPYLRIFAGRPVVDVGCGDLETTRKAPCQNYLGIDISEAALRIAKEKRRDWRFSSADISTLETGCCDLALCLDLLIHQHDDTTFFSLIKHLARISRKAIVVSGYNEPLETGGIIFYHQPLKEAFEQISDVAVVNQIGRYRDVDLLLVIKKEAILNNPYDISLHDLAWGVSETPTPDLLIELVRLSRETLGFFPKTMIRTIEYPWFAHRMKDANGICILDVGAGVNVLPLWLANRGAEVTTIDMHSTIRDPADKSGWNEWGFLDYSLLDERVKSHNVDMSIFKPVSTFYMVYSVSVIEHMPAQQRRKIIPKMAECLMSGGTILLSIDLIPGSSYLWRLSEGKVVDPDEPHGSLRDFLDELENAGLAIIECSVRRHIRSSRTDVAFIEARKLV